MRRRLTWLAAPAAAACAAAVLAGIAAAPAADLKGYDGSNPFDCRLQQVGDGTDFPRPNADPFCVEYDKRGQNVNDLSIAEFLADEPVRVAAASDKCFYYQRDHWRSRVLADENATETYSYDGAYFFDKARGEFGVFARNFTVNNRTVDPTVLPGFPSKYEPYFGEGRGGLRVADGIPVDPRCVRQAEREDPYRGGDDGSGRAGGDGGEGDDGRGGDSGGDSGGTRADGDDPGFRESRRTPRFTG